METRTIQIEKRNKGIYRIKDTLNYITNKYDGDKERILNDLRDVLSKDEYKLGYGGSHIWCSNMRNERLFIIYFQ